MLHLFHPLGWATIGCLWTMLLMTTNLSVLMKPQSTNEHLAIDRFSFGVGLSVGILIFLLTL